MADKKLNIKKITEYWKESSQQDYRTMLNLFMTGDYVQRTLQKYGKLRLKYSENGYRISYRTGYELPEASAG